MIKIKHINEYNKNKLENYNGEEIGLLYNKEEDVKYDNFIYSYDNSPIYNSIIDSNKQIENFGYNFQGGATKKVAKKTPSNESSKTKKIFSIKEIQNELLNDIVESFPFILKNNTIDEIKLLEIVHKLLKKKNYNLSNIDIEMIIRHLRENILSSIKTKIIYKHPMFETIKNNLYLNNINSLVGMDNIINFKNKIMISRAISYEWNDLSSLINFNTRFSFKENLIHPLFVILYGLKFPGIEDLTILQDYSTMIKDLKNDDFDGNNLFLLVLRIADPNYLPTINPKYMTPVANENLRVNISVLLKEIAFSIRTGVFENKLSDVLIDCLSEIKNTNGKFEEEKMFQKILSVFSFKPTLIAKSKTNPIVNPIVNQFVNFNQTLYSGPEAVYNIEFPINDFYIMNENEIPVFSNTNLKNIVYDPISKKVIFSYNNNIIPDGNCIQENLLQNFYNNLNTTHHEVNLNDVGSTILSRSLNLEESFRASNPVTVLLTNGLFVLSIPRETIRYTNNPNNNLFYVSNRKHSINISPVLIEQTISINKIAYTLAGGLCYDILENINTCFSYSLNYVKNESKMGTYAILKLSNGKWVEYNPNLFLTNSRVVAFIDKALKNNYEHEDPINDSGEKISYNEWLVDNKDEILKKIINKKISFVDMYISEEEAMRKLSMYGNLLFYKEAYEEYKTRCEEKYRF